MNSLELDDRCVPMQDHWSHSCPGSVYEGRHVQGQTVYQSSRPVDRGRANEMKNGCMTRAGGAVGAEEGAVEAFDHETGSVEGSGSQHKHKSITGGLVVI
jgi:hypothetical protein